jgi:hypothetical protein
MLSIVEEFLFLEDEKCDESISVICVVPSEMNHRTSRHDYFLGAMPLIIMLGAVTRGGSVTVEIIRAVLHYTLVRLPRNSSTLSGF